MGNLCLLNKWSAIIVSLFFTIATSAATAPSLGSAQSFSVFGSSTVTNIGPSVVTGDIGVSPGTAIVGFPPGNIVRGSIHTADGVASQARNDITAAYINLAGQACNNSLTGKDLGGLTLTAGTYCFSSQAQLTGRLTLDAQGDNNAVFIFQIGTTLTTASNSSVVMINGGANCNVFWQVGSSATLGTTTSFIGNILALASISLQTGANIKGRALARTAAVTMDHNNISTALCNSSSGSDHRNYNYLCNLNSRNKDGASCTSSGILCIENILGQHSCSPQSNTLNVNCTDGFNLGDSVATHTHNLNTLFINGIESSSMTEIHVLNFLNHPGLFQSYQIIKLQNNLKNNLSGYCRFN